MACSTEIISVKCHCGHKLSTKHITVYTYHGIKHNEQMEQTSVTSTSLIFKQHIFVHHLPNASAQLINVPALDDVELPNVNVVCNYFPD